MTKIIYIWMLITGSVQPMHEKNDDRKLYILRIYDPANQCIFKHVYREEIYNYIESGTFKYDETITANEKKEL